MAIGVLRWTNDMLEQMPQVEGERYEIIQGQLYVTTAPHLLPGFSCLVERLFKL